MIPVTLDHQHQCTAFNKKDHRRCRLRKMENEHTCKIHRNYYHNWFQTHPEFCVWNPPSERLLEEYSFQIKNKYVKIPLSYMLSLNDTYHSDYYIFLMKYSEHKGNVNIHCFEKHIYTLVKHIFHNTDYMGYLLYIKPLFTDHETTFQIFETFWYLFIYNCIVHNKNKNSILEIVENIFSKSCWKNILFHTRLQESIIKIYNIVLQILRNIQQNNNPNRMIYLPHITMEEVGIIQDTNLEYVEEEWSLMYFIGLFSRIKGFQKNGVQKRVGRYKEEMIAYIYNPIRIEKYLENGYTFDDLDNM